MSDSPSAPFKPQPRVRPVSARALVDFSDERELVQVMMDAVQAHKRLYEDGKILHGDINPNTIFIVNPGPGPVPSAAAPQRAVGAIIDFDMPIRAKGKARGA
ncbi:hypothetical protein C2E23DRAFT_845658 [Lenzites betulinus]|nr:hypothetical protein C2E23DRAFT_845658 [Lenzites betulinus]